MALFDPESAVRQIERERVTSVLGVPTMVVGLLEHLERHPADLSSVEMVSSGGAMVAPELVRRTREVFGGTFQTVYGQTEFSPLVTQHHHDDTLEDICNTAGRPIPQTAVSIRDVEHNAIVPVGTVGEICVRGCSTMLGYHGDAAATRAAIDAEGWLHTGDLGTLDERGYLRVTGRVKEMIIRGGENHFPAEIENVLLEHPAVAEVSVVGLPDEKWGEVIGCFIRSEDDAPLDVEDLRRHCRANLSPQKTPTVWRRVEEFPLTGSRKIRKFRLREQFLAGEHEGERRAGSATVRGRPIGGGSPEGLSSVQGSRSRAGIRKSRLGRPRWCAQSKAHDEDRSRSVDGCVEGQRFGEQQLI